MIKFLTSIFIIGVLFLHASNVYADELVHEFKNPSFSGVGTSSHYLTIENQEFSRKQAIADDIEAALLAAQREAENTTIAKFIRNLESRIFAQLSKQLVEKLFQTCTEAQLVAETCTPTTMGSFVLEGNVISYEKTTCDASRWACQQGEDVIVLTVISEDGTETQIVLPVGAGTAGTGPEVPPTDG